MSSLVRGVALGPERSHRRSFDGRADTIQHIERLKAAADDVIQQHFNGNYDAKVAGKRQRKLKEIWRRLTSKYEDGDSKVDAKAHS